MPDQARTREHLEKMIRDGVEESYQLDYKSALALGTSDSKKDDITKDVSAFANSAGGLIIYGMKEFEQRDKKHLVEKIDPVDGRVFTREWMDQVAAQINPRIADLRISPVRVGPEPWHVCYVVEIPKGETAHQARDRRYYRRHNFESVSMPDHEIRDVMNRRKHPKLDFRVRLIKPGNLTLKVVLNIRNLGRMLPQQYGAIVILPTFIGGKLFRQDLLHHPVDGKNFYRFTIVGREPVFPGADVYCDFEIPYQIGQPPEPTGESLICTLYADEMLGVRREVQVEAALRDWA